MTDDAPPIRLHVPQYVVAHRYVAHLCEEMAQTVYEQLARNNVWYRANPDRAAFVRVVAPTLRVEARAVMAGMLARHDVSQADKDYIFDALLADKSIPAKAQVSRQ